MLFTRLYEPRASRTLQEFEADLELERQLPVWPNLLETIGVLHATGIVSTDVAYRMWGAGVVTSWKEDWKPVAEELRAAKPDAPRIFQHFERLSDEMEKHAARLGEPFAASGNGAAHPAPESQGAGGEGVDTSDSA